MLKYACNFVNDFYTKKRACVMPIQNLETDRIPYGRKQRHYLQKSQCVHSFIDNMQGFIKVPTHFVIMHALFV